MSKDNVATLSNNTFTVTGLTQEKPLHVLTEEALALYFRNLEGLRPNDLYGLVLSEIEKPLFKAVMAYTRGNQSRAAEVLGINRGTLRKKLKTYGLLH